MNQTWENNKKSLTFSSPEFFFVGFTSIRCYTLFQAINVCNFKEN